LKKTGIQEGHKYSRPTITNVSGAKAGEWVCRGWGWEGWSAELGGLVAVVEKTLSSSGNFAQGDSGFPGPARLLNTWQGGGPLPFEPRICVAVSRPCFCSPFEILPAGGAEQPNSLVIRGARLGMGRRNLPAGPLGAIATCTSIPGRWASRVRRGSAIRDFGAGLRRSKKTQFWRYETVAGFASPPKAFLAKSW